MGEQVMVVGRVWRVLPLVLGGCYRLAWKVFNPSTFWPTLNRSENFKGLNNSGLEV
jgi:hypothetical protein